jgi:PAS domain S-box-containing protein
VRRETRHSGAPSGNYRDQGTGPPWTPWFLGLVLAFFLLCAPSSATSAESPLRPVTLQLKWTHQFQFAGYYAAQSQGYYQEEGLAVSLKERRPGIDVSTEVLKGRAEFAVSSTEALLQYQRGKPLVMLAPFFQHSANVLIYRTGLDIAGPADLRGKRIMLPATTIPEIMVMLANNGVEMKDIRAQQLSWNIADLIENQTDAMSAYLTDQPDTLARKGIPIGFMLPAEHGADFYGDCLITSRQISSDDPGLVDKFLRASRRGWIYAMAHPHELAELIHASYNLERPVHELEREAQAMRPLMLPELVEPGTMSRDRWERILATCTAAGLIKNPVPLDSFFHVPARQRRSELIDAGTPYILGAGIAVSVAVMILAFLARHLRRRIKTRTRELELSRESLRQVIDLVPTMIYAKDREGRFLLANRSMADSLGSTVDALIGLMESDIHQDREQVRRRLTEDRTVFDSGYPKVNLEEPFRRRDGSLHWLQTTRLPYVSADTGEPAVLGLSVDITNHRRASEALRESEERFRAIFAQTYQLTGILSLNGTIVQINESALDHLGMKREDVEGRPFWEVHWFERSHATRDWIMDAVHRAAQGLTLRREVSAVSRDGAPMVIDFSIKPARDNNGAIIFLIPEGRDITDLKRTEDALRRLNEDLEQRVASRTTNLEEAKEELERSLDELHRTQEELILSEKLAALGGLVAGVAHEINTPLGIGITAISFLENRIQDVERLFARDALKKSDMESFLADGRESTDSVMTNLKRAAGLVNSFKQVAADQSSEMARRFNLHAYVDEVLPSLYPQYRHTGHSVENTCPDVEIDSYPGAIAQIITNLLSNTLSYAYPDGRAGHIRIGGSAGQDSVTLTFSDDGVGIPPEITGRIFEPFVTTRRGQGGTGLGLHIVFNIVNKVLGGTIRLATAPGDGTTFTITIPRNPEEKPDSREKA